MIGQIKPQNLKDPSNSYLLVCVFNNAKDYKNLTDISDLPIYKTVRLNCSIVNLKLSVSDLFSLVTKIRATTNNYTQMGLASLNVYFIVHPDTRDKFNVYGPYKNYSIIRFNMLTYDEFLSQIVGSHAVLNKRFNFL